MSDNATGQKEYLGDGIYVRYSHEFLILMSDDPIHPTNTIYLNDEVISAMLEYLDKNNILTRRES